ncbi:hypothetical protein ACWGJX_13885 [Streptomyces sp. NPDC054775]
MPEYQSAEDLLGDAELRAEGLGANAGILVVEGPDDKRLFARHVLDIAQVLPAGGRTLLLSAYEKASTAQRSKIIFVTDCDYEVRRGNLRGGLGLVITTLTDLESDLIGMGLLDSLVTEMVPRALDSEDGRRRVSEQLRRTAEDIALPLGRIRMAAQPLGVELNLDELRLHKFRNSRNGAVEVQKLIDSVHTKVAHLVSLREWRELVSATPDDRGMCHGKDLLRAVAVVIKDDLKAGVVTAEQLARNLRLSADQGQLEKWDVVRRIKNWQQVNGRSILS